MEIGKITAAEIAQTGLRNGFFEMDEREYHGVDAISQTALKEYKRSPAHYLHSRTSRSDDDPNAAFLEGKAWHLAIFEPQRFEKECVAELICDRRTKAGKEKHAEFMASSADKLIIPAEVRDRILEGVHVLRSNEDVCYYLEDGFYEVRAFYKHPDYNFWFKAGLDCIHPLRWSILDLKTTTDASPKAFGRSIENFGYYIQAGFYTDIVWWLLGKRFTFNILALEKKKPFYHRVYRIPERAIQKGRNEVMGFLEMHKHCLKTGKWKMYDTLEEDWSPSEWFYSRD